MTTETLIPAADASAAPAPAAPATSGNTLSLVGLILSILSIPLAMGPLAIVGIVLGFVGRRDEPAAQSTATWAIVVGFVSLFGWIVVGFFALLFALPFAVGAWAFGWF